MKSGLCSFSHLRVQTNGIVKTLHFRSDLELEEEGEAVLSVLQQNSLVSPKLAGS